LIFDIHSISEDITPIPELILPVFRRNNQSDSNGQIIIDSITFDSGISSIYFVKPLLIYPLVTNLSDQNLSSTLSNVIDLILNPNQRYGLSLSSYNTFVDGLQALNDAGIIGFCFGDMINFTLVSKVGSVLLLNQTQINARYSLNTFNYFRVRIYSLQNIPLTKTAINVDFNMVHFPSYLMCDYNSKSISEFKNQIIEFYQLSNSTDENGEILLKYHVNKILNLLFFYEDCLLNRIFSVSMLLAFRAKDVFLSHWKF